jgi:hypothetical protein
VPVSAASFRRVDVQGQSGLLIETAEHSEDRPAESILMWSRGDDLYVLRAALPSAWLLQMAQSLQ